MPENQKELDGLLDELFPYLTVGIRYTDLSAKEYKEQIRKTVLTAMQTAVDEKEQQFDSTLEDIGNHMKTVMLLKAMDEKWPSHIAVLYKLIDRERTYPEMEAYLPEYKLAAGNMYVEMVKQIRELFIRMYLNVRPQRKTENPPATDTRQEEAPSASISGMSSSSPAASQRKVCLRKPAAECT
jgi:preprotein translocase subunit SecA